MKVAKTVKNLPTFGSFRKVRYYLIIPKSGAGHQCTDYLPLTTLLIMAAGIGSRFGTGIKQLEPVDDARHIIMDYSIHDAIEAGFNHVVFIIRKDIAKEFKEIIGDRIASICSSHNVTVDYANVVNLSRKPSNHAGFRPFLMSKIPAKIQ